MDALREVANIGAGHAATALSQLTQRRISISVSRLQVTRLKEVSGLLAEPDAVAAGVLMHVLGDITGRALLLLQRESALRLVELMMRRTSDTILDFGAMEESALKETGNILCGAYVNALSDFLGMIILPSVPSLMVARQAELLAAAGAGRVDTRETVVSMETHFMVNAEEAVAGHFLLMPEMESLQAMLRSIRLA